MNAPVRKTAARTLVALLGLILVGGALTGCGGSGSSAQSVVDETFHSHRQIESGRLELNFSLRASGLASLREPVALALAGPFESTGSGRLPRFDLTAGLTVGGHTLHAGAISTAGRFFLQLEGASFEAPRSAVTTLAQEYRQASAQAAAHGSSTFSTLGVDPGSWLEHPVLEGRTVIAGAAVNHVAAGLDLARFLADAGVLSGAGGALGLGTGGASGLLSQQQRTALSSSLSSGRVDLYSGASDHLLRRLTVHATVLTSPRTRPLLGGLQSATLTLELQLADLNARQRISSPSNPRPISQLLSVLSELGLTSAGTGGSGESSASSTSSAYLQCIKNAGQQVSALQRCAALLGSY